MISAFGVEHITKGLNPRNLATLQRVVESGVESSKSTHPGSARNAEYAWNKLATHAHLLGRDATKAYKRRAFRVANPTRKLVRLGGLP